MPLLTTIHVILGKSNTSSCVSTCRAVLGGVSALITSLFRIVLLVFCIYITGGNSIFVTLNPQAEITANDTCQTITIVQGSNQFTIFHKSKHDLDMFLTHLTPGDADQLEYSGYSGGSSLYYGHQHSNMYKYTYNNDWYNTEESVNQTYLFLYGRVWLTFRTYSNNTPVHMTSYDDNGYYLQYFYCGDVSSYLNTSWLPVMVWLLVNILPVCLLSIIVLLFTLKGRCVLTCTHPVMILSGIFSHFHVGPVSYSKSNSGYLSFSTSISYLNILLTFLGLCLNLHLTTEMFCPFEASPLWYILPMLVCVPIFLISAIIAICFFHCFCCKGHRTLNIFNPSDPDRWYIKDTEDNVVPEEDDIGMEDVQNVKMENTNRR